MTKRLNLDLLLTVCAQRMSPSCPSDESLTADVCEARLPVLAAGEGGAQPSNMMGNRGPEVDFSDSETIWRCNLARSCEHSH